MRPARVRPLLTAAILILVAITSQASAQKLYFADNWTHKLHRINVDGTHFEPLVSNLHYPPSTGVAVDWARGMVYWADPLVDGVSRCDLNGRHPSMALVPEVAFDVSTIALDQTSETLFWTDSAFRLNRAAPGDSERTTLAFHQNDLKDLTLDLDGRKVYWVEWASGGESYLSRLLSTALDSLELDGSNLEPLTMEEFVTIWDLEYDAPTGQVFWLEFSRPRFLPGIARFDPVTKKVERLIDIPMPTVPRGFALDSHRGFIYWFGPPAPQYFGLANTLHRSDLDGKNVTQAPHIPLPLDPNYMALDPRAPGDFNLDDHVDAVDFRELFDCVFGPIDENVPSSCTFFDADPADGRVDLNDVAAFQRSFGAIP